MSSPRSFNQARGMVLVNDSLVAPAIIEHAAQQQLITEAAQAKAKRGRRWQPQSQQQAPAQVVQFKCKCATRDCYQGVVDADRVGGRMVGASFAIAVQFVREDSDPSIDGRRSMLDNIRTVCLPKVHGRAICHDAIHKITGKTNRFWFPRRDSTKHKRNLNMKIQRGTIPVDEVASPMNIRANNEISIQIVAWFVLLLPILDRMPDQSWYQVPAADRKEVWHWYIESTKEPNSVFTKCSYSYFCLSGDKTSRASDSASSCGFQNAAFKVQIPWSQQPDTTGVERSAYGALPGS